MTPEEIKYALDYLINKEDDLDKLTPQEMRMFLTGHFGRELIESQGWKLRSNGHFTWWQKVCSERGPIRIYPHWCREFINNARIGGMLEVVNKQRRIIGLKDISFDKFKKEMLQ